MNGLRRVKRLLLVDHPDDADELLKVMRRDLGENVIHLSDADVRREAAFFARHLTEATA